MRVPVRDLLLPLISILVCNSLSSCKQPDPPPTVDSWPSPEPPAHLPKLAPFDKIALRESAIENLPENQIEITQDAVQLLYDSCEPLKQCWGDVIGGRAQMSHEYYKLNRTHVPFGQGEVVRIYIEFGDGASCKPIVDANAQNTTIQYTIKSGKNPGIHGKLEQTWPMCDLDPDTGWKPVKSAAELGLSNKP